MKPFIFTLFFTCLTSYALDIDKAVQKGLDHNFAIKEQEALVKESYDTVAMKRSSFLPVVDLAHTYSKKNDVASFQLKTENRSSAILSYNLFNGFLDYEDLQSAKHLSKASQFTLQAKKHDTVLYIKTAYIDYLKALQMKNTYEDAYKLFSKQYDDAKERFTQGLLSKNNLLQIDVNRLDAKQKVLHSVKNLKLAKRNIVNLLGGEEFGELEDIDTKNLKTPLVTQNSIENRSEVQALQAHIKSLHATLNMQKSAYYPKLDISASYNKYHENSSDTGTQIYPKTQKNIALNATWKIYQGGENFDRVKIYKHQIAQYQARLEQLRLDISLQLEEAILNHELAQSKYKTASLALKQAQENYKIVSIRYKEGLETTTNVVDANYLLSNAKQRYHDALYDNYLSVATIERVLEL